MPVQQTLSAPCSPSVRPSWLGVDLSWLYADLLPSLYRQTRCRHDAGDVLHEALLRYAVVALKKPLDSPHAYLRRVASSVLVDRVRHASRFVELPESDEAELAALDPTAAITQPSAQDMAELRERLTLLQTLLECLPPKCREVFWLLRIEGYTQPEIAQRLGISLKTVESHVARALVQLSVWREQFS